MQSRHVRQCGARFESCQNYNHEYDDCDYYDGGYVPRMHRLILMITRWRRQRRRRRRLRQRRRLQLRSQLPQGYECNHSQEYQQYHITMLHASANVGMTSHTIANDLLTTHEYLSMLRRLMLPVIRLLIMFLMLLLILRTICVTRITLRSIRILSTRMKASFFKASL